MLQALVNHLWQSTLFAAAIALLCCWLRQDRAGIRFRLWLAASVKFLVPFSSLYELGARIGGEAGFAALPETVSIAATLVARPFGAEAATAGWQWLLLALWAGGCLIALGRWYRAASSLRRMLRSADIEGNGIEHAGRTIRVYRTHEPVEPGVVGVLDPAILLPAHIERYLDAAQLDAVMAHELCHIERRDNLLAAVHMLVESLFWFFPPVRWIGRQLIEERERACDERVVDLGHLPTTYAEGVLNVCEHFAVSHLPCAAGVSGGRLSRRITQIMRNPHMSPLNFVKKAALGLAAAATLAVPVLFGSALAQDREDGAPEEYLPIEMIPPVYPQRAAARGLEGYVIVEFTVARNGTTKDLRVIESSLALFERPAIEAARKFRYRPRMIDGTPVEVPGVRNKFQFELETADEPPDPDYFI